METIQWCRVSDQLPPAGKLLDTISEDGIQKRLTVRRIDIYIPPIWLEEDGVTVVNYVPLFWKPSWVNNDTWVAEAYGQTEKKTGESGSIAQPKTIAELEVGESGWVVPWSAHLDLNGIMRLDRFARVYPKSGGTIQVQVRRSDRGCHIDTPHDQLDLSQWNCSDDRYVPVILDQLADKSVIT